MLSILFPGSRGASNAASMSPKKYRTKKPKRILMMCHAELVPPDSIEGLSDEEIKDWRAEFDVLSTLREIGHEAEALGMEDDIDAIRRRVLEFEPDLIFNLIVEFHGTGNYDQNVVSLLELQHLNYTGCNPRGLTLARDKGLFKQILEWHGLPCPHFGVFEMGKRFKRPAGLEYPLFVKSLNEEASLGISYKSIVRTDQQLAERVEYIHRVVGTAAIAEEYIEGREFYLGVIGNKRLETFPIWELVIEGLPKGKPNIATREVKWDLAYQKQIRIKNRRARGLSPKLEAEMARVAKAAYRAMGMSGYARMDIRMRADGSFFLLEANPNPDITYGEDFAESAEAAGIEYEALIDRIVRLGCDYPAEWKSA